MTPLQRTVGFDVAEELYDMLPIKAQLILDLKIEGYNDGEIAMALEIPRTTVIYIFRKARYSLLSSKLKLILDTRLYYKETHISVMEEV